jgi:ubiquinone biosynthesis accessory factor UbiK
MQRLDIVSRDEFEVQSLLLARTREKLDAMEERVRALEAQLGIGSTNETEVPGDVHAED